MAGIATGYTLYYLMEVGQTTWEYIIVLSDYALDGYEYAGDAYEVVADALQIRKGIVLAFETVEGASERLGVLKEAVKWAKEAWRWILDAVESCMVWARWAGEWLEMLSPVGPILKVYRWLREVNWSFWKGKCICF